MFGISIAFLFTEEPFRFSFHIHCAIGLAGEPVSG
jgi:hypothetical protein